MNIGIFGTGTVGQTLGSKLTALGHAVKLGSRSATNEKSNAWAAKAGSNASAGTFADAAKFGEILFNCTNGSGTLAALEAAGADNLGSKLLIDVSNPLDFSNGFPPSLTVCNTDSLAEQIQRAYPKLKVVKALNTVNASLMVAPSLVPGDHDLFIAGNDAAAKQQVTDVLTGWFGWKIVHDMGDITAARATEQLLPIWVRLYSKFQSPNFNFHIAKA